MNSPDQELPRAAASPVRCGTPRRSRRARWRAAVLVTVQVAILAHILHWKLAGRTLSPLEPSEAMKTLELGYLNAGFLFFALLILSTLVFGRFFCGWACHVVAYQDFCSWLLKKVGLKPRPLRSRLLALVPLGAAFYMFVWPSLQRWMGGRAAPALALQLTTEDFWASFENIAGPWVAVLTFVVDGALVVYFLGAKGFCTYGCPYGAIFGLADRAAPGRIRVSDACDGCGHCTASCSSNVRVHEEVRSFGAVVDPGCMKCMDCVSVCPKNALHFGFGRPSLATRARRARPRRRRELGWGEELLMGATFLVALFILRGLYQVIPFLLAIGLAVLSALGALTAWRLVRRRELRLQHHVLRREGRLTRAGLIVAVLLGLWFLFLGHSGWVHYHAWQGERLLREARAGDPDGRLADRALDHLLAAERAGLASYPVLDYMIGSIRYRRGELPEALRHLERAVAADPEALPARFLLAEALAYAGRAGEAEQHLRHLVTEHPGWQEPLLPLAKLLLRRGAAREAEGLLNEVLAGEPGNAEALRLLGLARRAAGE